MSNETLYESPAVVYEGDLEIQAGSPINSADPFSFEDL
jgi:hypothetical protein